MIFLINDANILIDLLKINLLDTFFQLEFDFQVTDVVLGEIQEDNVHELERFITNGILNKQGFLFEDLVKIQEVRNKYQALSIADCSCLYLAEKLSGTLLTGDGALRRIAEEHSIPVHGILWIFDEFVAGDLITKTVAYDKLLKLRELNPRLPSLECQKQIKIWSHQS